MKRVGLACVLLGLVFLWGCGGGEEPTDDGTDTQPPVAATDGAETVTPEGGGDPADPGDRTDPATEPTVEQQPAGGGDDGASARKPAEGKLAAHATALSMITKDHFAVIKLDVDKIRNASLTKQLPGPLEELAADELPPGMDEVLREVETVWVALSPGAGNLADMLPGFGEAEVEKFEESSVEEFAPDEDFEPAPGEDFEPAPEEEFDPAPEEELETVTEEESFGKEAVEEEFDPAPEEFEVPCDEEPAEATIDEPGTLDGDFGDPSDTVVKEFEDEDFDGPVDEGFDDGPPGFGPGGEAPPPPVNFSVYARFKTADALQALLANAPPMEHTVEVAYGGDSYLKIQGAPLWIKIRDRELVASTDEAVLKGFIDAAGKLVDSPLIDRLQQTNVDAHLVICATMDPIAAQIAEITGDPDAELPPQVKGVTDAISAVSLAIDLEGPQMFDLHVEAADADGAKMMHEMVQGLIGMGNEGLAEGQKEIEQGDAPEDAGDMLQFAHQVLGAISVQQEGSQFSVSLARPDGLDATVEKVVAMVEETRKVAMKAAHAQMLGLAAFNYKATHAKWPANVVKDGAQLLSWRVQLLPYLEHLNVYELAQRDEAWDSETNKQLLENMPQIFGTASATEAGTTTWRMLAPKPGPQRATSIMFIDAGKGKEIPWTQPDEFKIDPADPLSSLGEEPEGGYMTVFGDGHVEALTSEQVKEHFAGQKSTAGPPDTTEDPTDVDPPDGETSDPSESVDDAVREWTDSTGTRKVQASLLKVEDGKVTLRRADNGKEVTLPIDKLSDADQEYLQATAEP